MRFRVAGALLLLPFGVEAQKSAPPLPKPCVFDTAAHRSIVTATVYVAAFPAGDTVADTALSSALGGMIRPRFQAPESMRTLFYPNTGPPQPGTLTGPRFGTFAFAVASDGRVSDLLWVEPTADSATNVELLRAFTEGADSGYGVALAPLVPGTSRLFRVEVSARTVGTNGGVAVVSVPIIHIDAAPKVLSLIAPRFPPGDRIPGTNAKVQFEFLVDESGRAVRSSIRVVSATSAAFIDSAVTALLGERFEPARSGGCPVRFWTEQAIRYTMKGAS